MTKEEADSLLKEYERNYPEIAKMNYDKAMLEISYLCNEVNKVLAGVEWKQ